MVVNESVFKAGKPQFKYAAIKEIYEAIAAKKHAKMVSKLERQRERSSMSRPSLLGNKRLKNCCSSRQKKLGSR